MLKLILLISFVLENVFDFVLVKLNDLYVKKTLPENVSDVYDKDKYNKWINYRNECKKLSSFETLISSGFVLVFLIFNLHAKVFNLFDFNKYVNYLLFILIFNVITLPVSIPFEYYQNFKIEEKYGFNKTTHKTFAADQIKSFVVSVLLSFLLFFAVMFLFEKFGNWGILFTIVGVILFNLGIATFSLQVLKIFNKFTPLEDGELRTSLLNLCEKYNVKVKNIYVMDASKRTTRANAFCTGMTKKKTMTSC